MTQAQPVLLQLGWLYRAVVLPRGQSQKSRAVTKLCYIFILKMGFVKLPLGECEEGKEVIVCNM